MEKSIRLCSEIYVSLQMEGSIRRGLWERKKQRQRQREGENSLLTNQICARHKGMKTMRMVLKERCGLKNKKHVLKKRHVLKFEELEDVV